MPGANWNVPTSMDPSDPRHPIERRDLELVQSEVAAREARDRLEFPEEPQAEETEAQPEAEEEPEAEPE
jgi:hypothetical protein